MKVEYYEVLQTICKPTFVLLNSVGLGIIVLSFVVGLYFRDFNVIIHTIGSTIGSAILTIGISLPVAIYYQSQHNERHFKIIKACDTAKIDSIFVSRLKDKNNLQEAIDKVAKSSQEITLLGVAFPSLFDPSESHTYNITDKIRDHSFKIRILLLNPKSEAAKRRNEIERGHQTIDQINHTLDTNIVSTVIMRFDNLLSNNTELKKRITQMCNNSASVNDISKILSEYNKISVRLYDFDPIVFLMGFDECVFSEQYNFGNPERIVDPKSCIGKHIPVIQYNKNSDSYAFYKCHFEYVWKNSQEYTDKIILSSVDYLCQKLNPIYYKNSSQDNT